MRAVPHHQHPLRGNLRESGQDPLIHRQERLAEERHLRQPFRRRQMGKIPRLGGDPLPVGAADVRIADNHRPGLPPQFRKKRCLMGLFPKVAVHEHKTVHPGPCRRIVRQRDQIRIAVL